MSTKDLHTISSAALAAELGDADTIGVKLRRMARENKLAVASAVIILLITLAAIFAPLLTPYGYAEQDLFSRLQGPSAAHWLGTDELGRDVLTRLLYGARVSLLVGVVPTVVSMLFGAILGLCAGFFGGWVDTVIMRLADIMLAFPSLLLAMVIMYILGGGIINIFIAIALIDWASVARVVRSQTLSVKENQYVEAAESIGVKKLTIIFRHILPNCIPSMIVLFTLNIPGAILSESAMSFLGIGVQPPACSWGLMADTGRTYLTSHPMLSLAPSVCIMLVVLAFNFLGDGLRDVLDPYMNRQ